MEDNNPLKDILLPKTNENEDLETISEQTLMPLFDVTRFEFCTRDRRDKGIDITFDTKKDGSHLGFRFIIQLKATNTIKPNTDGSLNERSNLVIQNTPFGRFGEPEELLGTLHWLASDASKFVTGTLTVIDGGFDAFCI